QPQGLVVQRKEPWSSWNDPRHDHSEPMVGVAGGDRVEGGHDLFDRVAAGTELYERGTGCRAQAAKPPSRKGRVLARKLEDREMRGEGSRVPEGAEGRRVRRSDRDDGVQRRCAR